MQCYFSQEGLKPLNTTGASAEGSFTNIVMNGQDVFRFAVRAVPAVRHPTHHAFHHVLFMPEPHMLLHTHRMLHTFMFTLQLA